MHSANESAVTGEKIALSVTSGAFLNFEIESVRVPPAGGA